MVFSLVDRYQAITWNDPRVPCAALEGVWGRLRNAFGIGLFRYCPASHLQLAEPLEKVLGEDFPEHYSSKVDRAYQL